MGTFQVSDLESQLSLLESEKGALQLELSSVQEELQEARENVMVFTDSANEMRTLYQRELAQHGKSMESLLATKDQVCVWCVWVCGFKVCGCRCVGVGVGRDV